MQEIMLDEDFFTFQPMDDPRFEYCGTVVSTLDADSPVLRDDVRTVIAGMLEEMTAKHGPGWAPYFLYVGDEALQHTFLGPILFWRRQRPRKAAVALEAGAR
jgi:hypothetical protein